MSRAISNRVSQIRNRRTPARSKPLLPAPGTDWMRAREWHNPLRSFSLSRAINLIESYPRGEFADLMWTLGAPYMGIECADADLSAILSRRTDSILEMDWNASPLSGDDVDTVLAAEQAAAVKEMMNGIRNLYGAIEHLQCALVRGFAHCEILEGIDGTPIDLAQVDQWHVVRDGIYGGWRYNPDARQTNFASLKSEHDMPEDRFLIREVRRPIGRIALIKFARANLSEADWGAFVERYGLASGVVEMPPDVRPEDEAAFLAAAQDVAEGGSGALPNGSKYYPNSSDKGSGAAPFKEHLDHWQQKLVLVGTGGKLTMLTESGSGTLAGGAHAATFEQLARGDARRLSELVNEQLVIPYLNKRYPEKPISAHWELAFREEVDGSAVVDDAAKLSGAGYTVDPAELSEKTGLKLTISPKSTDPGADPTREGGAKAMHSHANAPESEGRENVATDEDAPLVGDSDAKVKNRTSEGVPDGTKAREKGLESMLADLLRGGVEAWSDVLAEAVAEGAADPETDPETEDDLKDG